MIIELYTSTENTKRSYQFDCLPDETIYDAAERAKIRLPVSCRNGVCHVCRATLKHGDVVTGARKQQMVAKKEECVEVMLCKTWPETACELEVKSIYGPGELPVKKVACQVTSAEVLQGHVYQIELLLPAGKIPEFFAGQYLSLNLPNRSEPSFFSIASRPGIRTITLHIQADPHLESALETVTFLQECAENSRCVSVSLPFGEACLTQVPSQDLIFMAAGTGFAQMKSMIEYLLEKDFSHSISLYWGVRKQEDLYLESIAKSWEERNDKFSFKPLISDIENIQENAHHNQLSDAVLADHLNLESSLVFVSGSPKLVFSAMDALTEAGLPEEQFYSDVLAYASRG